MAGRPHRHRDRAAADPDLERLLDRDRVPLDGAARHADDVDRALPSTAAPPWSGAYGCDAPEERDVGVDASERCAKR